MAKVTKKAEETSQKRRRPALSPEARENQLVSLAINLAEKQLREGTASTQVITHYLRIGSMKEQKEREKLEEDIKLLRAKTEAYEMAKDLKEVYSEALAAMKKYSGNDDGESCDEYEDY